MKVLFKEPEQSIVIPNHSSILFKIDQNTLWTVNW